MRVYVGGTFDCCHPGHIRFLQHAALLGDVIVSLNTDEFAERYKRKPLFTLGERAVMMSALRVVKQVIVNTGCEDSKPAILASGAKIIAHGDDWVGEDYMRQLGVTQDWLDDHGIVIRYVPYTQGISTTSLLERMRG
jgi:cytidyltransferase-like protein